jgi:hypothetical protein
MDLGKIKDTVTLLETHLQTLAKEIELEEVKLKAKNVSNQKQNEMSSNNMKEPKQQILKRKHKPDVFKLFFQQKLTQNTGSTLKELDIWKCANRFLQPLDMKLSKLDIRRFMFERGFKTTTPIAVDDCSKRSVIYQDVDFIEDCNDISQFIHSDSLQFRDVPSSS